MTKQEEKLSKEQIMENARVGYQVATALETYEGHMVWFRYSAMLVANSIVMAVIGYVISSEQRLTLLLIGMPIAGLILCRIWLIINARGFDYFFYWLFSARELEENYLRDPVQTFSRGGRFAEGEVVHFNINGQDKTHQVSPLGKIRIKKVGCYVIYIFMAMYFLALISSILQIFGLTSY